MRKSRSFFGRLVPFVIFMLMVGLLLSMIPVQLRVPYESQLPEFPNGCEVVSLSMVMNYYGIAADPGTLNDVYLKKEPVGVGDPRTAYIGDPRGEGYYSFQEPLADAADAFLQANNAPYQAVTHPFMSYLEIAWHVHKGRPVITWYTIDDAFPERVEGLSWDVGIGPDVQPYQNLHVFVIDGISGPYLHVQDPIHGTREIPLWEFLPIYYSMGLRAMTVAPVSA